MAINRKTKMAEIMSIQSTLAISKSKGPSETLRDIRALAYQISRTEKNTNRTKTTNFSNELVIQLL